MLQDYKGIKVAHPTDGSRSRDEGKQEIHFFLQHILFYRKDTESSQYFQGNLPKWWWGSWFTQWLESFSLESSFAQILREVYFLSISANRMIKSVNW